MKTLLIAILLFLPLLEVEATSLISKVDRPNGENAVASFLLERSESQDSGNFILQVLVENSSNVKGYGITLSYDTNKYKFDSARLPVLSLDDESNEPLFVSTVLSSGDISVGAASASLKPYVFNSVLVEFVFTNYPDNPTPHDFRVVEGAVVDIGGAINYIDNYHVRNLDALPDSYQLGVNHPNPFNPSTSISYQLPTASHVTITIYNVLGQEIKTLVDEMTDAGIHYITWDGSNSLSSGVASGVYFYKMTSQGFSQTRRMMLLK